MGVRGICGRLVGDRPPRAHVGGPRPSAEDWLGMEKRLQRRQQDDVTCVCNVESYIDISIQTLLYLSMRSVSWDLQDIM